MMVVGFIKSTNTLYRKFKRLATHGKQNWSIRSVSEKAKLGHEEERRIAIK